MKICGIPGFRLLTFFISGKLRLMLRVKRIPMKKHSQKLHSVLEILFLNLLQIKVSFVALISHPNYKTSYYTTEEKLFKETIFPLMLL